LCGVLRVDDDWGEESVTWPPNLKKMSMKTRFARKMPLEENSHRF
jgi:hypothetical protein